MPSSWEHKCFLNDIVTAASESLINTPGLGFIVLLSQLGRGIALAPFLYLATCRFEPRVKGCRLGSNGLIQLRTANASDRVGEQWLIPSQVVLNLSQSVLSTP